MSPGHVENAVADRRERCGRCKRRSGLVWAVADADWRAAVGTLYLPGTPLCLDCFDILATYQNVHYQPGLRLLGYVGARQP